MCVNVTHISRRECVTYHLHVPVHPLAALVGSDGEQQSTKQAAAPKKDAAPEKDAPQTQSKMEKIFGFKKEDLTSWHSLVTLLNRPTDPAALGIFRCLFGKLRCR